MLLYRYCGDVCTEELWELENSTHCGGFQSFSPSFNFLFNYWSWRKLLNFLADWELLWYRAVGSFGS